MIYLKKFIHRGLMFGGFGPIIVGIIFAIMENTMVDFQPSGYEILLAIVSTYLLAFIQAGASVINQIEEWSLGKTLLVHFLTLYLSYIACYIINTWIPFDVIFLSIFSIIFAVTYLIIWLIVYISVKIVERNLNNKLK